MYSTFIHLFDTTDFVFYFEEDTTQISYESGIKGNYNHSCCISNNHWLKDPYWSRMESNVLSIEVKRKNDIMFSTSYRFPREIHTKAKSVIVSSKNTVQKATCYPRFYNAFHHKHRFEEKWFHHYNSHHYILIYCLFLTHGKACW